MTGRPGDADAAVHLRLRDFGEDERTSLLQRLVEFPRSGVRKICVERGRLDDVDLSVLQAWARSMAP